MYVLYVMSSESLAGAEQAEFASHLSELLSRD